MSSLKGQVQVTPGSGTALSIEQESGGKNAPVHFAFSGRYIPIKPGAYTAVSGSTPGVHIQVTTTTDVDLLTVAPSGATRLLLYVATNSATFWDNGFSPHTDGQGGVIDADSWMEFANLNELSNLKFLGVSGTADLYMNWYKTS